MTAEALVCWQFLGLARDHPACGEASDFIVGELPGEGTYNLYYWYYATLGMYQLRGPQWNRWNTALRTALVSRQLKGGPQAGSWDTSDLWGGHGGRVLHHGDRRADAGSLLPLPSPLRWGSRRGDANP